MANKIVPSSRTLGKPPKRWFTKESLTAFVDEQRQKREEFNASEKELAIIGLTVSKVALELIEAGDWQALKTFEGDDLALAMVWLSACLVDLGVE